MNVKEGREVSSRLMWMNMALRCERWMLVAAYGPGKNKSVEGRDDFWEGLSDYLKGFRADQNVILLGDLNARVGDFEIDWAIGKFGVPWLIERGEKIFLY